MISTSFETVQAERKYKRKPPQVFNASAKNDSDLLSYFYRTISEKEAVAPEEGCFVFTKCYVYEGSYVVDSELNWIDISVTDYGIKNEILDTLRTVIAGNHHKKHFPSEPGRLTVVIAKSGYKNYGHILTDIAPKIVNIKKLGINNIDILIPGGMKPYCTIVSYLLEIFGISANLVQLTPAALLFVESLLYFGPVAKHNTRKSPTLIEMRDKLWNERGISPVRKRRLFVARLPSELRALKNAPEVEKLMIKLGYEIVYPAQLNFFEQVSTFSQASHIVGSLGAGMVNALFAAPETRIVLLDPGLVDFYFWDLACLCEQNFSWLFTQSLSRYSDQQAEAKFNVDSAMLEVCLRLVDA